MRSGRIEKVGAALQLAGKVAEVDCKGQYLLPGVIDDQVHFREPGLTHKGSIATEARAAVAGGVTSFMEMPNTSPPATTVKELEKKYEIAAHTSPANFSFYLGATNENYDEVAAADYGRICGIKAFLGSSTGNLLVDDEAALEKLFSIGHALIATHCEDEARIRANTAHWKNLTYLPEDVHARVRDEEACYLSSSKAVARAKRLGTRLHVLHITTEEECALFEPGGFLEKKKRITSEVCVHHLHFTAEDYSRFGDQIKCNPSIKAPRHKAALWKALAEDRLDVIATDHAPHTWEEKQAGYWQAPSGLPLVQHPLTLMLKYVAVGAITLPKVVEKMCHLPAELFKVRNRGYLDEGCFADMVLVSENEWTVSKENLLYKCGWSPLEGTSLPYCIDKVWVNGKLAAQNGKPLEGVLGMRLEFDLHE